MGTRIFRKPVVREGKVRGKEKVRGQRAEVSDSNLCNLTSNF
jgi:hypothetical protein